MTGTYEEAYAHGFRDAQEKAKVEGRLVIVDSPELAALRARIAELEAENARLNALCDHMKIGWGEDAVRAEAAEAKLATAMGALGKIAGQPRTDEHAEGEGNFEEGYDACVGVARAAIRAMKSTTQTTKE